MPRRLCPESRARICRRVWLTGLAVREKPCKASEAPGDAEAESQREKPSPEGERHSPGGRAPPGGTQCVHMTETGLRHTEEVLTLFLERSMLTVFGNRSRQEWVKETSVFGSSEPKIPHFPHERIVPEDTQGFYLLS